MKTKIIHDINSAINALSLSFELLGEENNCEILPLMKEKMSQLETSWKLLKERGFSKR